MTDYDVVVAGAGTGGATTAYTLAKKGHSVLLVD
ncbi:MAG: FAD-dependent oxidoreductase, partial [Candidatus Thorarchaeota archaeon]